MKTNESLCETIGAIVLSLLMAALAMVWLVYAVHICEKFETDQERAAKIHPDWSTDGQP